MKVVMLVFAFWFLSAQVGAQETRPQQTAPQQIVAVESITIEVNHKLSWTVLYGEKTTEGLKIKTKAKYEADLNNAVMTVDGKVRPFGSYEALLMRRVVDMVTNYTSDSTQWWLNEERKPRTPVKGSAIAQR